jgi:hypothetical protein
MSREMIVGNRYVIQGSWDDYLDRVGGAEDAPRRLPGGAEVRTVAENKQRLFPIGFQALAVAASANTAPQAQPQAIFRGERLMLEPTATAPNFDLTDVKVGTDSQFVAAGNLFGAGFSPTAIGSRMMLDTAQPGILITLSAKNNDAGAAHDFKAILLGTVAKA